MDEIQNDSDNISWYAMAQHIAAMQQVAGSLEIAATNLCTAITSNTDILEQINDVLQKLVTSNNIIVNSSELGTGSNTTSISHHTETNNSYAVNDQSQIPGDQASSKQNESNNIPRELFERMANTTAKAGVDSWVGGKNFIEEFSKAVPKTFGEEAGSVIGRSVISSLDIGFGEIATAGIGGIAEGLGALLAPEISIPIIIGGALVSMFSDSKQKEQESKENAIKQQANYWFQQRLGVTPDFKLDIDKLTPHIAADNTRSASAETAAHVMPYVNDSGRANREKVIREAKARGLSDREITDAIGEYDAFGHLISPMPKTEADRRRIQAAQEKFNNPTNKNVTPTGRASTIININRALIENFNIHVKETKESYPQIKMEVEKALLEVLDDLN